MADHTSPRGRLTQPVLALAILLSLNFFSPFNHSTSGNETARVPSSGKRDLYAGLPLLFEQNVGQTDKRAKFISRGSGYNLFLTESGPVLALRRGEGEAATLRLRMTGADRPSSVSGLERQGSKSNYFIGATATVTAPAFAAVLYKSVYPGTDMIFYGNQRQLEYDFKLAPGADPARIELEFDGAESLSLTEEGDLMIGIAGGSVRQLRPFTYQETGDEKKEIVSRYRLSGHNRVRFEVGPYDPSKPLVIDPVISYSTYLGGSGADEIRAVAVDSSGNVYVAGTTGSLNFPTSNPQQPAMGGSSEDAFVAKLNQSGTSLLYSTYLGGNGVDKAWDIEVDSTGNAYITGLTSSTNFPTTFGAFQKTGAGEKAFVVKLTSSGAGLAYSTYLGGSEGHDRGHAIALDGSNNAYVVGRTTARNFPVTIGAFRTTISGFEDAFVAKLNSTGGSLVYATFLGGSSSTDRAEAIAVDAEGNAYVAGMTVSQDFPVTSGAFQRTYGGGDPFYGDAFVTKINSTGKSLVYSTLLGGIKGDGAYGIALDQSGQAYVVGNTQSPNYPTANAIQPTYRGGCEDIYSNCVDGFVTKLNANGSAPVFSTYVGGANRSTTPGGGGETIFDVAVDSSGNTYVAGMTGSTDFPTVEAFQANHAGNGDAFVAKIDSSGSAFIYSSYLGGPSDEGGYAIAIDSAGNAYVAGAATANGFPTAGAFQSAYGGGTTDGFITKISAGGATPAPAPSVSFVSPNQGPTAGGTTVTIQGSGFVSGASVLFGGVSATNVFVTSDTTITANAPARAAGPVEVKIINPDGQQAALASGYTYVQQPPSSNQTPQVSVTASPGSGMAPLAVSFNSSATDPDGQIVAYNWDFGDGQTSNQPAASHTYQSAGFFTARLTVTDNSGASSSASVGISVAEAQRVAGDVILYAIDARTRVGPWSLVSDATAAVGARMFFRDAGALPPKTAFASPNNYVELTFNAEAGIGYRLWVRGKAQNDSAANDSVFIQFSDSLNSAGFAVYRIGTSSSTTVNIEDCSGCGLRNWGWQDNGFGAGVFGPLIYFETSGTHTMRIQIKEDGFSFDQIVLSPQRYLNGAPGVLKNDATIVPRQ